jgi:hypothetical protein
MSTVHIVLSIAMAASTFLLLAAGTFAATPEPVRVRPTRR